LIELTTASLERAAEPIELASAMIELAGSRIERTAEIRSPRC